MLLGHTSDSVPESESFPEPSWWLAVVVGEMAHRRRPPSLLNDESATTHRGKTWYLMAALISLNPPFTSFSIQRRPEAQKLCIFSLFVLYFVSPDRGEKMRHLKLWAPPTWVHGWPQMKTAGKFNPHRYRLAVPWTHRDAKVWRRRAANESRALLLFFSFFL